MRSNLKIEAFAFILFAALLAKVAIYLSAAIFAERVGISENVSVTVAFAFFIIAAGVLITKLRYRRPALEKLCNVCGIVSLMLAKDILPSFIYDGLVLMIIFELAQEPTKKFLETFTSTAS